MGPLGPLSDSDYDFSRIETAAERDARDERELTLLRAEFPESEWDVRRTFDGWLATPAGAPVVKAITVAGIAEKLRRLASGGQGEPS